MSNEFQLDESDEEGVSDGFDDEDVEKLLRESDELTLTSSSSSKLSTEDDRLNSSVTRTCAHCLSSRELDERMFNNFGLSVCFPCKKMRADEYRLMSKSKAAKQFLLSDKQLKTLASITVYNPNKLGWHDMRLFLVQHLQEESFKLWGSESGLASEKEQRQLKRLAPKKKQARFSLLTPKPKTSSPFPTSSVSSSSVKPAPSTSRLVRHHTHKFGAEQSTGNEDEFVRTCGECGFRDVYESF